MKKIIAISILLVAAFVLVTFFGVEPSIEAMAVAVTGLIGSASAACQLLVNLTKVTPTTRDDEFVSGAKVYLAYLLEVLDMLAFNLPKEQAKKASSTDD